MVVSLPHDVLLDILFRVDDAAALFRCAATCRQWHDLVTDPTILRRRWPQNAGPSLAGFFIKNRACDQGSKVLVPTPGSALGRRCRSLVSFVPTVPDHAVPLASRRGLLVVRLVPPNEADLDDTVLRLSVCNLILGTCDGLPPLMSTASIGYSDYGCHGCAVLSGDDCRRSSNDDEQPPGTSPFYKVVIVTAGYENELIRFDVHAFSTDTPSWTTKRSIAYFWVPNNTLGLFYQTDAVVCRGIYQSQNDAPIFRGIAHWLFHHEDGQHSCLVQLNHDGDIMFRYPPVPMVSDRQHPPCICLSSDGTVLQVCETGSQLQIWKQEFQETRFSITSRWVKSLKIELVQPRKKKTQGNDTLYILGEKCGKLLLMNGRGHLYTADLKTGAMKEVADGPHARPNSHLDVVLLEMDWPAFFVSRLGTDRGEAAATRRRRPKRRGGSKIQASDRGKCKTSCFK